MIYIFFMPDIDMRDMKTECNSTKDPTYKKSPRTGGSKW